MAKNSEKLSWVFQVHSHTFVASLSPKSLQPTFDPFSSGVIKCHSCWLPLPPQSSSCFAGAQFTLRTLLVLLCTAPPGHVGPTPPSVSAHLGPLPCLTLSHLRGPAYQALYLLDPKAPGWDVQMDVEQAPQTYCDRRRPLITILLKSSCHCSGTTIHVVA